MTAHTSLDLISTAQLDEACFRTLAGAVTAFGQHEGFPAPVRAMAVRHGSPAVPIGAQGTNEGAAA